MHVERRDALPKIMLARYYGANFGRFLSVDPASESIVPAIPQTWNRYAYARNAPIRFIDPDGRKEKAPTEEDKKDVQVVEDSETPINEENSDNPQNAEAYNCHSAAFHDGQGDPTDPANAEIKDVLPKWDNSPSDDLQEQSYSQLDSDAPNLPGDKVIYGNDANNNGKLDPKEITHSATVVKVDSEGNTTRVTGKWGQGPVVTHHPAVAPSSYGTTREYYRKADTTKQNRD